MTLCRYLQIVEKQSYNLLDSPTDILSGRKCDLQRVIRPDKEADEFRLLLLRDTLHTEHTCHPGLPVPLEWHLEKGNQDTRLQPQCAAYRHLNPLRTPNGEQDVQGWLATRSCDLHYGLCLPELLTIR